MKLEWIESRQCRAVGVDFISVGALWLILPFVIRVLDGKYIAKPRGVVSSAKVRHFKYDTVGRVLHPLDDRIGLADAREEFTLDAMSRLELLDGLLGEHTVVWHHYVAHDVALAPLDGEKFNVRVDMFLLDDSRRVAGEWLKAKIDDRRILEPTGEHVKVVELVFSYRLPLRPCIGRSDNDTNALLFHVLLGIDRCGRSVPGEVAPVGRHCVDELALHASIVPRFQLGLCVMSSGRAIDFNDRNIVERLETELDDVVGKKVLDVVLECDEVLPWVGALGHAERKSLLFLVSGGEVKLALDVGIHTLNVDDASL